MYGRGDVELARSICVRAIGTERAAVLALSQVQLDFFLTRQNVLAFHVNHIDVGDSTEKRLKRVKAARQHVRLGKRVQVETVVEFCTPDSRVRVD